MDWILSIITVLASSSLGWTKGKWWAWVLNAVVSIVWIFFAVSIRQYGLILSAGIAIVIDLVSAYKAYVKEKYEREILNRLSA